MKKILWVLPKNTFPVNDGAKRANYSLLQSMGELSQVDILLFNDLNNNENEYRQHFKFNKLFFIPRKKYKSTLHKLFLLFIQFLKHPHLPLTASFFAEAEVKKQISSLLENNYDYVVFDGLHPYIGFQGNQLPKIIYRAHNVESDLWFTKSQKTNFPLFKWLLDWQGRKIQSLELEILRDSEKVWTISNEDKDVFSKNISSDKIENIFVGLNFETKRLINQSTKNVFMFLGKLDWEPNKDGLLWFLKNIWPNVDKTKAKLKIAGSGQLGVLEEFVKQEGIEFLGQIKDINEIYHHSDCSIVPIQYGSGTRIKVIESVSKMIPIISSSMGVQGSGLNTEDFYQAETEEEWINTINSFIIQVGHEKAIQAQNHLKEMYDSKNIAIKAISTLK